MVSFEDPRDSKEGGLGKLPSQLTSVDNLNRQFGVENPTNLEELNRGREHELEPGTWNVNNNVVVAIAEDGSVRAMLVNQENEDRVKEGKDVMDQIEEAGYKKDDRIPVPTF